MATIKQTDDTFANVEDIFEDRYYVYTKRLLCFFGQWPFQSILERSIRTSVFLILAGSLLIPMSVAMVTSWENIDLFMEGVACVISGSGAGVKIIFMIINTAKLRQLVDDIRDYWESSRQSSTELKILHEFGEKGRSYAISYFMAINFMIAAWISVPVSGVIMDYVAPLNYSRHRLVFQAEYGIDPNKYYTLLMVHAIAICFAGMQMYVAHDSLYMIMSQHACATIEVLRHHLENITQENEKSSKALTSDERDEIHYQQLVHCIERHKKIIKYVQLMESTCEWPLGIAIGLNVLAMSCTGARTVAKSTASQDVIKFACLNLAQVGHLLCITLPGHWIMQASAMIRDSAYDSKWYLMSLRSRRLIILFIRRSVDPCTITAGKLYLMSMENFSAVLQTSMSYITMLTSMQ